MGENHQPFGISSVFEDDVDGNVEVVALEEEVVLLLDQHGNVEVVAFDKEVAHDTEHTGWFLFSRCLRECFNICFSRRKKFIKSYALEDSESEEESVYEEEENSPSPSPQKNNVRPTIKALANCIIGSGVLATLQERGNMMHIMVRNNHLRSRLPHDVLQLVYEASVRSEPKRNLHPRRLLYRRMCPLNNVVPLVPHHVV